METSSTDSDDEPAGDDAKASTKSPEDKLVKVQHTNKQKKAPVTPLLCNTSFVLLCTVVQVLLFVIGRPTLLVFFLLYLYGT